MTHEELQKKARADYMRRWRAKQSPEWWAANKKYMYTYYHGQSVEEATKTAAYHRDWYADHRALAAEAGKQRLAKIKADPVLLEQYRRRRREWKRQKISGISTEEWEVLLETFDFKCAYCRQPFGDDRKPERDHIIPVRYGGPRSIHNVVPSCHPCNTRKRNRHVLVFIQDLK